MSARHLLAGAMAAIVASGLVTALSVAAASATSAMPGYVALGDSYSSGEGACKPVTVTGCEYRRGTNTLTDRCHRSHFAYPVRIAARLPQGWHLTFAACSGATTADVLTTGQDGEPAQLAALSATTTRLVTLTLGGNDAGFVQAISPCVAAHLFGSSCHGTLVWAVSQATLRTRLAAVYEAVHAIAPHARVLVLGYPRLFARTLSPTVPCDLAAVDAKAFNRAEDAVNASIAAAVKRADMELGAKFATFVDNSRVFKGHELCAGPAAKSYVNGLVFTSGGVRAESFHPNRSGQSVLAAHLRTALASGTAAAT